MLVLDDLAFCYSRKGFGLSVDSLSFPRGKVSALVGPNGAGKTTLFHLLAGLLVPSRGKITFDGQPMEAVTRAGRLALCLDSYPPDSRRTVESWLRSINQSRSGTSVDLSTLAARAQRFGIESLFGRSLASLSRGQGRRAVLAMVLCDDADCVLLDEPASWLDPDGIVLLREIIEEMRARGAVVVISSHLLGELENVADRYVFFVGGGVARVVENADLQREGRLRLALSAWPEEATVRWPNAIVERASGPDARVVVTLPTGASDGETAAVVKELVGLGICVYEVGVRGRALEEVFDELVPRG